MEHYTKASAIYDILRVVNFPGQPPKTAKAALLFWEHGEKYLDIGLVLVNSNRDVTISVKNFSVEDLDDHEDSTLNLQAPVGPWR